MAEKLPKKGMDGKLKTIDEVSLIEAYLVSVRTASPIIVIRDPNLDRQRELKPTPNPTLIIPSQSTANILSFIGS